MRRIETASTPSSSAIRRAVATPYETHGPAVLAEGLVKRFGPTEALAGIDLEIAAAEARGLLGHNGAGKTTAVRILATLLTLDGGRALVAGRDVVREAAAVRDAIAFAGQQATLDERLTGRENLVLLARLQRMDKRAAHARSAELLERLALSAADGQPPPPRARRRAARAPRPVRGGRSPRRHLLRRHAPPPRPRRLPARRPPGRVPRRADDRPRPGQPRRGAGGRPRARRRRRRPAAHDPVPRGGRPPLRRDLGAQRRARRRGGGPDRA